MKIVQYIRLHVKNSVTQIAHYHKFLFLRYAYLRYAKCLETIEYLKNLLSKKNTNFAGE